METNTTIDTAGLTTGEARFLVNAYYEARDRRKAAARQAAPIADWLGDFVNTNYKPAVRHKVKRNDPFAGKRQPCQKSPSTKTATRRPVNARSGFPASLASCSR